MSHDFPMLFSMKKPSCLMGFSASYMSAMFDSGYGETMDASIDTA
jgi:hypothetical protein